LRRNAPLDRSSHRRWTRGPSSTAEGDASLRFGPIAGASASHGLDIEPSLFGTPAGVALGQPDPNPYLRAGDTVMLEVDGLGHATQTFAQA
jgi:hypothetical protein